jgi:hypothetical protein
MPILEPLDLRSPLRVAALKDSEDDKPNLAVCPALVAE